MSYSDGKMYGHETVELVNAIVAGASSSCGNLGRVADSARVKIKVEWIASEHYQVMGAVES
jgi:hypothetical protein